MPPFYEMLSLERLLLLHKLPAVVEVLRNEVGTASKAKPTVLNVLAKLVASLSAGVDSYTFPTVSS